MKTVNILVTGIGGPIAQGIMMGLKQMENIQIIGADRRPLTSGHHFCDKTYQIPRYTDFKAYKKAILDIIETEEIAAVFPGLASEVDIYADFRSEIPVPVALPKSDHFETLNHKVNTYEFLQAVGLDRYIPEYYSFTDNAALREIMEEHFEQETYVVVKPADINPRFAGSQVNSLGAGVNFPEIFLTYEVLGETMDIEPDWDTQMFRYRVPVFYSSEDAQHPGAQSLQLNEAD